MTPTEWFYEYVGETPDIRLIDGPAYCGPMLTVLVLGKHDNLDESYASHAHHVETITAIRSKIPAMNAYLATQLDKLSNGAVDEMAHALDREIVSDEDYDTHELALDAYEALIAAGYRIVRP